MVKFAQFNKFNHTRQLERNPIVWIFEKTFSKQVIVQYVKNVTTARTLSHVVIAFYAALCALIRLV